MNKTAIFHQLKYNILRELPNELLMMSWIIYLKSQELSIPEHKEWKQIQENQVFPSSMLEIWATLNGNSF